MVIDAGARLFTVFFSIFGLVIVAIFLGVFNDMMTGLSERAKMKKEKEGAYFDLVWSCVRESG